MSGGPCRAPGPPLVLESSFLLMRRRDELGCEGGRGGALRGLEGERRKSERKKSSSNRDRADWAAVLVPAELRLSLVV